MVGSLVCPVCGWDGFDGVRCDRCGYGYLWCGVCVQYLRKHWH